jgi:diguanylate cyclase (GGDEF)-like protein
MHDIIIELSNSLSAIRSLSEIECQTDNEKDLIRKALHVLIDNQDMERCSFFLFDGDEYLVNVTGLSADENRGEQAGVYKSLKFRIGEGIIGLAAQSLEIQYCNDCRTDPRFLKGGKQPSGLPGSLVSVPVIVIGDLLGVLNISHPDANYFSDWHIRLMQIYKNMLGQLITNSRMLLKMEHQISMRTVKLQKALRDVNLLKERYESLSMIDELTGLYNRRYFYPQVEICIANSRRYKQPLCILLIDIDYFKKINDQYGHLCGDRVLIKVAALLNEQIRETDILIRFGGEEFVVIFTNTNCANGKTFAERIRQNIEQLSVEYEEQIVQTSVSIGMHCLFNENENVENLNIDNLVHFADQALYKAKENGRNRVEVFT